jgi:hypothetical protein
MKQILDLILGINIAHLADCGTFVNISVRLEEKARIVETPVQLLIEYFD